MFTSKEEFVTVHVKGIADVQMRFFRMGIRIPAGIDPILVRASNYVQRELQSSIIGTRGEVKSVDTGTFANSIQVDRVGKMHYKVLPEGHYPNGTPVSKIASILEYGTMHIIERRHFRNTKARTEPIILELVQRELRERVKRGS